MVLIEGDGRGENEDVRGPRTVLLMLTARFIPFRCPVSYQILGTQHGSPLYFLTTEGLIPLSAELSSSVSVACCGCCLETLDGSTMRARVARTPCERARLYLDQYRLGPGTWAR
jgi:hypothetical protein